MDERKIFFCVINSFLPIFFSLLSPNPELLMDSMVEMAQHLSSSQTAELSKILANLNPDRQNVTRTNSL